MAWNWLPSTELPANFWFYAVKRAAEVCNYFPHFELADQIKLKPDVWVLFKMLGLAAVCCEHIRDSKFEKCITQSQLMIAIGRFPIPLATILQSGKWYFGFFYRF